MADSTFVEPTVDVRVESQAALTILSPKKQDEFRSMSTEAQQNLTPQQTQTPSIAIGKGFSISTLTLEEVLAMKQKKSAESLRKLLQLRQILTEA